MVQAEFQIAFEDKDV